MVTHEPEQREFTDRVIFFRDGLIEREETISKETREAAFRSAYLTDRSASSEFLNHFNGES